MTRAELFGQHSFSWGDGKRVSVYQREGRYIARGRIDGKAFGETLGSEQLTAQKELLAILAALEKGTFRPPSHSSRNRRPRIAGGKVTVEELIEVYVADVKLRKGKRTATRYRNWLNHLLAYVRQPIVAGRYPYAIDIDRAFVIEFIVFLNQRPVSRNGREGAKTAPMAKKGIREILDRLKAMLVFARKPEINLLPAEFINPVDKGLLPIPPSKDPLRGVVLPVEVRVQLVSCMDPWQLTHIAPSLVLPCRPEEMAGLLIEDIDWENECIRFGDRFDGCDFTKGHQSWTLPVPREIMTLLCHAAGFRFTGPVLQSRRFYAHRAVPKTKLVVPGHFEDEVLKVLQKARPETPQDAKVIVHKILRKCGGVSTDELRKEFKRACWAAGLGDKVTFYKCREAVTSDYETINMPMLQRRYVTGHSAADILNAYTAFSREQLQSEMKKYWDQIRPLLNAISARARKLGIECNRGVV